MVVTIRDKKNNRYKVWNDYEVADDLRFYFSKINRNGNFMILKNGVTYIEKGAKTKDFFAPTIEMKNVSLQKVY